MPQTSPDAFEYEALTDEAGRTLTGGQLGTSPILAEQVQAKFVTTDASLSDLTARVAALESGVSGVGWMPIGSGTATGGDFTIDLTAGGLYPSPPQWEMIKVTMRVDLNAVGAVECRINGDSDAVYRSGGVPYDAAGGIDAADGWFFAAGLAWRIAHLSTISTGWMDLTIYNTAPSPGLMSFSCMSGRQSDDASIHRYTLSQGSLTATKTATSLFFQAVSGATAFDSAWWQAVGLRMVSP